MYIQYCANKPRSDLLIHDHLSTFFAELSDSITPKANIADLLMKPVQRIMKYHIMLKDFTKYSVKAGLDTTELSVSPSKSLHKDLMRTWMDLREF